MEDIDLDKYIVNYEEEYVSVDFNKDELKMLLLRSEILYETASYIVFYLDNDYLSVSVKNKDSGALVDKIKVLSKNANKLTICFNPSFLKECLDYLDDEIVKFYFKDNVLPVIVTSGKDGIYKNMGLIMPIRFDE